jgi:hypothetical protein
MRCLRTSAGPRTRKGSGSCAVCEAR